MNRMFVAATLVVASAWARAAIAQAGADTPDAHPRAGRDTTPLDAAWVVKRALASSPEVHQARALIEASAGRRATAAVVLPSNPTLAASLSARHRPPPEPVDVWNWGVTLSQELELAGQRGARIDVADADALAITRRLAVAEQEVAAAALVAYYDAIAAREAHRFAVELTKTSDALAALAEGRAREALLAGVEADVARAEASRIGLLRFEGERRVEETEAALAALLDLDERRLVLPDALAVPVAALPAGPLVEQALRLRGEVAAAEAERQVLERRLALVRRERVPNPTVSLFAERGEINDRVLGVGLAFPLPLPAPVGRTRAGELAEALAQIRAAESSTELVRRRVRVEVARAEATFKARTAGATLFAPDLLARGRADLAALREALASRQLSLREALAWQRTLIELLQGDIQVRLERALAWVDLRRVVGLPLATTTTTNTGGTP